jgi:starvation-inducible DNA-binding protein
VGTYPVPGMKSDAAERIITLLQDRLNSLNDLDYSIGRAGTQEHLGAMDVVYAGIIVAHRGAIDTTEDLDLVTQDMLIGQARQLEQFHWFVRAHLEGPDGSLTTGDARTEKAAAARATKER